MFRIFQTYLKENAGLTEEALRQLTPGLTARTVAKGEVLLHEGEVCKYTFFVEKGLLRSFSISESGKEHIIQFAPEQWFISDRSSIYFNRPSDFFIEAVEESEVVMMENDFICLASEISPSFRQFNERLLQNHILHLQRRVNMLLGATAEKCYLDFVQMYPDLMLRVPQWMIASYMGITPESLSRVRKKLATQNDKSL